jgi:hyperosmotically inducible protein
MNKINTTIVTGLILSIIGINVSATSFAFAAETDAKSDIENQYVIKEVNKNFANNIILKNNKIDISSDHGLVKLSGTVPSKIHYIEAVSVASSSKDIHDVDASCLNIQPSKHPINDTLITSKIKGMLTKNKLIYPNQPSPYYVEVETKNHNVYLTGRVKDVHQSAKAIETAYAVNGVKNVTSYLKIEDIRQPAKS